MTDRQEQIARAYGKAVIARMKTGSTLGQALDQAYADVNPNGGARIRAAVVASLVGVDLDDLPARPGQRFESEDSGDI